MTHDNYRDYISDTCRWAIAQGIAKNRKEFARLAGVNYCSLTAVINGTGRNSGRYMVRQIRQWRESKEREAALAEYRNGAAKDFVYAMLQCTVGGEGSYPDPEEVCGMAVLYADELIKQLVK